MSASHIRAEGRAGWAMTAPALTAIGLFFLLPALAALVLSFTDFDIYALANLNNLRFIGLDNYQRLVTNPLFWQAMGNTMWFVVFGVPMVVIASLAAAMLVNARTLHWRGVWRVALFAPFVTTLVATAVVWNYLLHTRYGLINYALGGLGIAPVDWLGNPKTALPAILLFVAWKSFGYNMIIFLAALQSVSRDLEDAARVDGAGAWMRFRHVTLPAIAPTVLLVAILTVAGMFQLFAEPYVMTQGGPGALDRHRALLHVRRGLQMVEPRVGLGGRLHPLPVHPRGDVRAVEDRQESGRDMIRRYALTGFTALVTLIVLMPLMWMVSVSFMAPGEAAVFPPPLFPSEPTLENYRTLFGTYGIGRYIANSVLVSTLATMLALLFVVPAGYAFAKLRFTGRDAVFQALVAAMVVPGQIGMLPLFLELKAMGLVNSYAGALVPWLAGIFGIFLVRQFCLSIPTELLEAARIDGAERGADPAQDRHADAETRADHARLVHLPRQLERLHVAADRARRPATLHASRRARRAQPRACAGQ